MITFIRTNSSHKDFIDLVQLLDQELAIIDGKDHSFYSQYNKIDAIRNVVIAYEDEMPIGCGAFKAFDAASVEIKRMYVAEAARGRKVASGILSELENWAQELGYQQFVLETGKRQPKAIGLYQSMGYTITANYGQYVGVENSVCFSKNAN